MGAMGEANQEEKKPEKERRWKIIGR